LLSLIVLREVLLMFPVLVMHVPLLLTVTVDDDYFYTDETSSFPFTLSVYLAYHGDSWGELRISRITITYLFATKNLNAGRGDISGAG
jgi:hypothetical protein